MPDLFTVWRAERRQPSDVLVNWNAVRRLTLPGSPESDSYGDIMDLGITSVFYGLIGLSVAVALWLSESHATRGERWFRVSTAVFFWPIYLPLLLRPKSAEVPEPAPSAAHIETPDELAAMLDRIERELDLALGSLCGWSENLSSEEQARISELRSAWRVPVERLRELDALLAQPTFVESTIAARDAASSEPLARSEQSRQQNVSLLRDIRERMHRELLASLARVRELVTRIHLAKFTGTSLLAKELVEHLAAAITGNSAALAVTADSERESASLG